MTFQCQHCGKIIYKAPQVKRTEVRGVVVSIEEASVVCEIYLHEQQERTMMITLPKSFFPSNIRFGTSMTIAYHKDSSGFKRPIVTIVDRSVLYRI